MSLYSFLNLRSAAKITVLICALFLHACATAPDRSAAFTQFKLGNYKAAEQSINTTMKPNGKDALLYHLEIGVMRHLDNNFDASNRSLSQAERIVEQQYTKSVSESFGNAFLAGAQSAYQGFEFEHVLINYYKALNFIGLAQQNPKTKPDFLDQANVEIRRLNNRLKLIQQRYGDYPQDSDSSGIKGIFSKVFGEKIDRKKLLYRNDAFAQYVSGLIFELNNEIDNARVSYQQAAETYENGFSKQYQLGKKITEQAWLDTLRIMKIDGAYRDEIPNYVEKKLSNSSILELSAVTKNQPELTIIQHLGMTPERGQLNLQLTAQAWNRSLVLQPIPFGTIAEQQAQEAWFQMLYADKDFFDVMQNFASGGFLNIIVGQFTKIYPLGPLWDEAERSGLVEAINSLGGVRIAVPYYKTDKAPFGETKVLLNGKEIKQLNTASSIQKIAYQEQVRNANRQIQAEIISESLKAVAALKAKEKAEKEGGAFAGALAAIALKSLQTAAASADTRNWNTLPAEIRIGRIALQDGENRIELITQQRSGANIKQTYVINAKAGNQLWKLRTLSTSRDSISYAPNAKPSGSGLLTIRHQTNTSDTAATQSDAAINHQQPLHSTNSSKPIHTKHNATPLATHNNPQPVSITETPVIPSTNPAPAPPSININIPSISAPSAPSTNQAPSIPMAPNAYNSQDTEQTKATSNVQTNKKQTKETPSTEPKLIEGPAPLPLF